MKILFVTDLYPLGEDKTIPKIVEDFACAFKELNHQINIIRPNFLLNSIIRHHKIFKNGKYFKNNIEIFNRNFFLPFIFENKEFIQQFKDYDLIISHMPSGHIYTNLINKILKLKHVAICHQSDYIVLNNFKYSFYFKRKLKNALKNADLIGGRNKFLKEKLNANFILPSFIKKETIIQKISFSTDKLKIITLSKLIKRKNIDKVILALSKVNFDFEYSIYGDGKERKNLEKLIKKYDLEKKIKIYSYIEHNKIYQKLDENDIFILPSINETFGISYLEAMSRGLITIGVKNTGIDGVIKNNENGFLINSNVDEIIATLDKINKLSQKEKMNLSANTTNSIKNYEKEKVMKKYLDKICRL